MMRIPEPACGLPAEPRLYLKSEHPHTTQPGSHSQRRDRREYRSERANTTSGWLACCGVKLTTSESVCGLMPRSSRNGPATGKPESNGEYECLVVQVTCSTLRHRV